jgi:hypothetical protein
MTASCSCRPPVPRRSSAWPRRSARPSGVKAERVIAGVTLRTQWHFDTYLAKRKETPSLTLREHLRAIGGAIEV